ncbi:ribbon-helix-helix protein, CopG family [Agrobacterium rhizogenes]|uniref:CopG family ribbon-helix-helix protein n=1 Tax=Rhizobium rhizogenes TaxID=359 RepID=UPI0015741C7E|nr:ribbon-helix-helix protein, CopG family [Rhizobium rhizogenes]NTG51696.1 ribbon-helix-helix protein, CopG family [Rhizobium rhizogenes]
MTDSTTITIRIPVEIKDKLETIAQETSRSRSYLASEALSGYVNQHFKIKQELGLAKADAAAGNVVTHSEAVAELRAVFDAGLAYIESWQVKGWSRKGLDDCKNEYAAMLHPTRVDG